MSTQILKTENPVKLCHAINCIFGDYAKQKDDWISNNPNAEIIEEIKNLYMAKFEIPDLPHRLIGVPQIPMPQSQQVLMITWAIVYVVKD